LLSVESDLETLGRAGCERETVLGRRERWYFTGGERFR
jgi:hypothetical protein